MTTESATWFPPNTTSLTGDGASKAFHDVRYVKNTTAIAALILMGLTFIFALIIDFLCYRKYKSGWRNLPRWIASIRARQAGTRQIRRSYHRPLRRRLKQKSPLEGMVQDTAFLSSLVNVCEQDNRKQSRSPSPVVSSSSSSKGANCGSEDCSSCHGDIYVIVDNVTSEYTRPEDDFRKGPAMANGDCYNRGRDEADNKLSMSDVSKNNDKVYLDVPELTNYSVGVGDIQLMIEPQQAEGIRSVQEYSSCSDDIHVIEAPVILDHGVDQVINGEGGDADPHGTYGAIIEYTPVLKGGGYCTEPCKEVSEARSYGRHYRQEAMQTRPLRETSTNLGLEESDIVKMKEQDSSFIVEQEREWGMMVGSVRNLEGIAGVHTIQSNADCHLNSNSRNSQLDITLENGSLHSSSVGGVAKEKPIQPSAHDNFRDNCTKPTDDCQLEQDRVKSSGSKKYQPRKRDDHKVPQTVPMDEIWSLNGSVQNGHMLPEMTNGGVKKEEEFQECYV